MYLCQEDFGQFVITFFTKSRVKSNENGFTTAFGEPILHESLMRRRRATVHEKE
jgi:hypothetical protein